MSECVSDNDKYLYVSLQRENLRAVKESLKKGANPNCLLSGGVTPFHLAVGHDDLDLSEKVTSYMLRYGADPNVRSSEGSTPLHIACAYGRCDLVALLLGHNADPTLIDQDGLDALENAVESGCELCQVLVSQNLSERNYKGTNRSVAVSDKTSENVETDSSTSYHTCPDCSADSSLSNKDGFEIFPSPFHTQASQCKLQLPQCKTVLPRCEKSSINAIQCEEILSDCSSVNLHESQDVSPGPAHDSAISTQDSSSSSYDNEDMLPRTSSRLSLNTSTETSPCQLAEPVYKFKNSPERRLAKKNMAINADVTHRFSCLNMSEASSLTPLNMEMPSWDASVCSTIQAAGDETVCAACEEFTIKDDYCKDKVNTSPFKTDAEQKGQGDWSLITSDLDDDIETPHAERYAIKTSNINQNCYTNLRSPKLCQRATKTTPQKDQPGSYRSVVSDWLGLPMTLLRSQRPPSCADNDMSVYSRASCDSVRTATSCISSQTEVVVHREADSGFSVVETRLVPHCIDNTLKSTCSCQSNTESVHDWRDTSIAQNQPLDVTTRRKVAGVIQRMTDKELRAALESYGEIAGPVTATTRSLYERRLHLQRMNGTATKHNLKPANHNGLPPEVNQLLHGDLDLSTDSVRRLETSLVHPFTNPDQHYVKWREGVRKVCFNYLLLDPRVTQNLPCRAKDMDTLESFCAFLRAVFYVGKGTRSRPYAHFKEALAESTKQVSDKVQQIRDIWGCGLGVISLHIFQNVIPVEAYTREACMIEALGLQRLTNKCKGQLYGPATTFSRKQISLLGLRFFLKAYNIMLHEGERQIRPHDIKAK